jgi:hypothetical protein
VARKIQTILIAARNALSSKGGRKGRFPKESMQALPTIIFKVVAKRLDQLKAGALF